jgi:hypothetical protein
VKKIYVIAIVVLLLTSTAQADLLSLKTQTGNNIGLSFSSYRYEEPAVMHSKGSKMGLDVNTIHVLQNGHFVRGDLRYAFGLVDYNGSGSSGSASGEPDWYIETRVLVGIDWTVSDTALSPYTGLGYRYLFNDARGVTSTGAAGYRRESNYVYLPIGIIHRMTLNDQAGLESTLEYDHLLAGKQVSKLSDTGLGYSDMKNSQNKGYGLKFGVMYKEDTWAIGPYAYYWNIGKSETALLFQNGIPAGMGWEPENNTVEFGLRVREQF